MSTTCHSTATGRSFATAFFGGSDRGKVVQIHMNPDDLDDLILSTRSRGRVRPRTLRRVADLPVRQRVHGPVRPRHRRRQGRPLHPSGLKGTSRMFYPIAMAINALILFVLAILWEVTLRPTNPIVPIALVVISLLGFWIAAEEVRPI